MTRFDVHPQIGAYDSFVRRMLVEGEDYTLSACMQSLARGGKPSVYLTGTGN
jgi:hypothetical protein